MDTDSVDGDILNLAAQTTARRGQPANIKTLRHPLAVAENHNKKIS